MSFAQILAFLAPFAPVIEAQALALEQAGITELDTIIATVQSPDLKLILTTLAAAVDGIAKAEIAKLTPQA